MAKKKTQDVSRSQAIRDYLAKYTDATASVIIPALADRGINVKRSLVDQVKRRMKQSGELGHSPTAGDAAPTKKRAGKKAGMKKSATGGTSKYLTADDLVEAKKLADELGGIDQARKALKYLEELG